MRFIFSIIVLLIVAGLLFLWLWGIPAPTVDVVKSLPTDVLLKR